MASRYQTGAATWTQTTRTIVAAMNSVFVQADADERRLIAFRIGTAVYYGNIATFTNTTTVIVAAGSFLPSIDGTIDDILLLDAGSSVHSYQAYLDRLMSLIKFSAFASADQIICVAKAVDQYNSDSAFLISKKVTGTGASSYSIATIFGSLWKHGASSIAEIEYPTGQIPRLILKPMDFYILDDGTAQDGSNLKIQFVNNTPTAAQFFNVLMSTPRILSASSQNFPDTMFNFETLCILAAAFACDMLASQYAQSTDGTLSLDAVDYRDRQQKYLRQAEEFRNQYQSRLFGSEGQSSGAASKIEQVDISTPLNSGEFFH